MSSAQPEARGQSTGLALPADAPAFEAAGADFLTRAFRSYGALPEDVRVSRITRIEPCAIGSTGQKLLVSVEYDRPDSGLPTELFVKFSRHLSDAFHDRRRFELESEIRLFDLARKPGFPIAVPRPMFGDFDPASGTGVLILERIPFGVAPVEPLRAKCMDHEIADPLEYYRAIIITLARLAGAQHAGRLSPEVDELLPFDPDVAESEDEILASEADLRALVADYADFAAQCPQLVPERLRTPDFIARLADNAVAVMQRQHAIKGDLHNDPRYVALTHFNPNIDNAWFWRNAARDLECGLFDWQRARRMNVAYALWGGLCAAPMEIWNAHLDDLLSLFVEEYHASGGPLLPVETLTRHLQLYAATIGVAGLLQAPALIRSRLPEVAQMTGPLDPRLLANEGARCFLHVFTIFLNMWTLHGFAARLDTILSAIGEPTSAR